jgi:iron complex outermembrane receptor protein
VKSLGNFDLELFVGVDNLLDESYSLGNDLNAFAGRFYQPAPTRNWYGGIKLGLNY